jgi:hypothetical protein
MAGNSGAIKAGRAYVEIYGDQTPLMSAMKGLPKGILAASAGLGAIGGTIGGLIANGITSAFSAVTSFASNLGEVGGRLVDMSDRTGVGVEALAELEHAATMGGTSLDALEGGLTKMGVKLADAAGGSKTAVAAFDAIGVSVTELQGLSPDQQFERIADGLAGITDPGARAAAAMDIFGKSGADLLPMMKDGAKGIRDFREEAKGLGRITEEDARAVDELGDTFANVQTGITNAGVAIAASFAPVLNDLGQVLVPVVNTLAGAASTVGKMVSAMLAANPPLTVLSSGLSSLGGMFDSVLTAMGPWGETIRTVLGDAGAGFSEMFGIASESFQGIVDALMAGDISAAFDVMVAGLNVAWQQGLAALGIDWVEIWATIQDTFNQASGNIAVAWIDWTSSLAGFWNDLVATVRDIWDRFTGWLQSSFVWIKKLVGAVSEEVAAEQQRMIGEATDEKIGNRNAKNEDANRKIREDQQAQRDSVQQQRDARTAEIRKGAEENSAAKQLADARARLNAATKAAAEKRAAVEAAAPVDPAASMRATARAGTSAMFASSAGAISFGGAAAGMAANQGPINKLVTSSEETAENTKKMLSKLDAERVG